jgi:hypothetical protein
VQGSTPLPRHSHDPYENLLTCLGVVSASPHAPVACHRPRVHTIYNFNLHLPWSEIELVKPTLQKHTQYSDALETEK